ncbi:GntR family transcriptional regulator [Streptomyces europaeiscabiei]|uniref:GntR family transcriptional regulator n=1 Tax=Streptomyces TaxID=1883 RepID=UPI00211ABE7A|nr:MULTISPECIES: GntR family transcriptional regulator [Streptomyces]MDX3584515.1 GntR family transcriptional regulator [Streptomyces europaeiscabiei]MDX3618491.1 GntR family transcriptional regulator [Streptomyces europaeiscabiei]MDX3635796.1 GntR family transcriptional regulator [Streptomyces europaeiscabiei]MDX3653231.1 GntR family transcriptional regulator [Streptomyces europaeiscabiei]WUD33667.1 GntR family transcriptional regulator [Streptomyces europaeiscabiei]
MSGERGDGGGKGFNALLEDLRTRIADGTYALDTTLPTQRELADEFRVSRDTVQRVLRELKNEGWIESRQGSGSRVVKSPIHSGREPQAAPRLRAALGPFVTRAFAQPVVRLDVFTLTSESLDAHVRLQAERIRTGELAPPQRIELRMLQPDGSLELPYPRARNPVAELGEAGQLDRLQGQLQERLREITRRHTTSSRLALQNLRTEGLVPSVEVEVRTVPLVPTFKLYLRRGVEALFGPYEVVERPILLDDGTEIEALDVLGLGSTLTRHVNDEGDPNSTGSVFMESMQTWFDSCWERLASTS